MLDEFWFAPRSPGCMSLLKGMARQAHTKGRQKTMEAEFKGTAKAGAPERRTKEYKYRSVERGDSPREKINRRHMVNRLGRQM